MKKTLIYMVAMSLLPIFAMAGVFKTPGNDNNMFFNGADRAHRLTQRVYNSYIGYAWEPESRELPTYSAEYPARIVALRTDNWENDAWQEGVMDTQIVYNQQGRAIELVSTYHIMNFHIPILKQTSEYDAQNRLLKTQLYRGEFENPGLWIPVMWMHFEYGAGTSIEVYAWNDDSSYYETDIYYSHVEFNFDAQGRITEETTYTSADSLDWELDSKSSYVYHPQDPTTGSDIIEMIANQFTMMLLMEGDFLPGKIMSQTHYDWDGTEWVLSGRDSWEYNIPLQITSHLNEDYENNAWRPIHWQQYFYDHDGLLVYIQGKWWNGAGWNDESKVEYYWEQITSNQDLVTAKPTLKFSAHPNPFTNNLKVEADTGKNAPIQLEVYNLRGQKIYSQNTTSTEINWNGIDMNGKSIAAGLYYIRLSQDGSSNVKRILKVK